MWQFCTIFLSKIPCRVKRKVFHYDFHFKLDIFIDVSLYFRFVGPFLPTIQKWEKSLSLIYEVLDQWLTVQRKWMYLESIFIGGDIRSQLPEEAKKFDDIDKTFTKVLENLLITRVYLKSDWKNEHYPFIFLFEWIITTHMKDEGVYSVDHVYYESAWFVNLPNRDGPTFSGLEGSKILSVMG